MMTINGEIAIAAPANTDWFNNPVPENGTVQEPVANAPFFYTEVKGDFVFRARVRPNHRYVYDACALMVIRDEYTWAKAAFEKSDFGTKAAVCVVTDQVSDDANGCNIDQEEAWQQIVRAGDIFCVHYSLDGERFDMVRLFRLPAGESVKVGLEAQSPAGEGGFASSATCPWSTERWKTSGRESERRNSQVRAVPDGAENERRMCISAYFLLYFPLRAGYPERYDDHRDGK